MILAVLAVVTMSFLPAEPKVGDLVTITFPAPVVLDASRDYEVVARHGNVVVVRTFEPRPFALAGTMGNVRFRNLKVPMQSVLKQGDDFAPAPLAPPRPMAWPSAWWIAAAIAALLAIATCIVLWLRAKKRAPEELTPVASPEDRFRAAVLTLRANPSRPLRWAALADETRKFLAATRPRLGSDLTTAELVPKLDEREGVVEEILRQGDLEKFSRRGAVQREFDELADRVLELAS
jgi:hypothetical protein